MKIVYFSNNNCPLSFQNIQLPNKKDSLSYNVSLSYHSGLTVLLQCSTVTSQWSFVIYLHNGSMSHKNNPCSHVNILQSCCDGLKENVSKKVAVLGGVALLEEVCHCESEL